MVRAHSIYSGGEERRGEERRVQGRDLLHAIQSRALFIFELVLLLMRIVFTPSCCRFNHPDIILIFKFHFSLKYV